jgi:hypothetical protein
MLYGSGAVVLAARRDGGRDDGRRAPARAALGTPGLPLGRLGIDGFQAERSPDGRYRTTPLKGLFSRSKGGFYHDGRFADYAAVIEHYDLHFKLGLDAREKGDLQEFLKSL